MFLIGVLAVGVGATLVMDLWALFLKYCFGIPSLNYQMVGRWLGHFPHGRFIHANIGQSSAIGGETILGWVAHYAIGIIFAAVLLLICGQAWLAHPTFLPAVIFGIVTVVSPFFLMQPGMGAGVAASKTPKPNVARIRSLMAHTAFGVGLYISAVIYSLFISSSI